MQLYFFPKQKFLTCHPKLQESKRNISDQYVKKGQCSLDRSQPMKHTTIYRYLYKTFASSAAEDNKMESYRGAFFLH